VGVDAGQGGHDCGARSPFGLCEKTVTLDLAKRVAALLRKQGAKVTMTRENDRYVSLKERVEIARRAKADLFVSLHVNASRNRRAHGVETYVYGARASGRRAQESVRRENAEANYMEIILSDLEQQAHHESSIRVAGVVEDEMVRRLRLVGRAGQKVFEAPFYVLARAGRPAVLVEVGFITNQEEERRLRSPAYRARLADSIVAGLAAAAGRP
jgi:N-acetylmuramoyl-L-alanine amidase